MANIGEKDFEQDFVKVIQHKNNSSGLAFLHERNNMDLNTAVKSGDASNTSSPQQSSSTAEKPLVAQSAQSKAMTSSDKIMSASPDNAGGSQFRSSQPTQNLNTSMHHNNNINNNSQNDEKYNDSNKSERQNHNNQAKEHLNHNSTSDDQNALPKGSPSNASHFSAGSGVLSDTPPPRPARKQYANKSRSELNSILKEREDRVKRVKEEQEAERLKKSDEWKSQAIAAQKFREQQDYERKRVMDEARNRELSKQNQIKERREKILEAERERREELLKKNLAREERIEARRKSQGSQIHFGFGSSTPRMIETRQEPSGDVYRRSTSSSNVHGHLMTQSMYVPSRRSADRDATDEGGRFSSASGTRYPAPSQKSSKRSTSVYGLDKSGKEGNEGDDLMTQSFHAGATPTHTRGLPNRRRTDLTPTVTPGGMGTGMGHPMTSTEISRASTPGRKMMPRGTPGVASREGTIRSPSAMSNASNIGSGVQVRLRHPRVHRKPRPTSIAVSGMSQSMYDKKANSAASTPSSLRGPPRLNTPDVRKKGPGSVGRGGGNHDDPNEDAKSNTSSTSSTKATVRRTPAQVKAADARKPKAIKPSMSASLYVPSNSAGSAPTKKQSVISNNKPNCGAPKQDTKNDDAKTTNSDSKENIHTPEKEDAEVSNSKLEITPDIISDTIMPKAEEEVNPQVMEDISKPVENESKETENGEENASIGMIKEQNQVEKNLDNDKKVEVKEDDSSSHMSTPAKKIITSEEEAKARFAEKRRQMKEKMEREAELERQRLAEIERLDEERRLREEEEERRAMEEAEKLAAEARKAEEERLQKAIEEAQKRDAEERVKKEEEERIKKEADQKAKEESEKKQAELEEKLKKEEEERLARKKRIEEIMARTRGGTKPSNASPVGTPRKETTPGASGDESSSNENNVSETPSTIKPPTNVEAHGHEAKPNNINEIQSTDFPTPNTNCNISSGPSKENIEIVSTREEEDKPSNGLPHSPVVNGQDVNNFVNTSSPSDFYNPLKPDLLGDISNKQKQINILSPNEENGHLLDTQTVQDANQQEEKLMNEKNSGNAVSQQQPLLDLCSDNDPFEMKINNNASVGVMLGEDEPILDQIIDLSSENSGSIPITKTNHNLSSTDTTSGLNEDNSVIGAPIIAFEDSITASTKSDVPTTADLLS